MSVSAETNALVGKWLQWDRNEETIKEIKDLVANNNEAELKARLAKRIAFGTAGLRGPMQAGFACMNDLTVIQASQGLCKYLQTLVSDLKQRGVVVGYDGRHHSKEFAEWTAATFLSQGIKVYLFSTLVPTPFVSFATPHLKCAAGVMVTASHNPKDDNGYKVYWDNGCQINVPHDKGISDCIEQNLAPWEYNKAELLKSELLQDPTETISAAYLKEIVEKCCFHKSENTQAVPVTYTAMHGVGAQWVAKAFEAFSLSPFIPVPQQVVPDAEFPTVAFPNPEEGKGALKLAIETAEKAGSVLILATDPDADRLAVAEKLPSGEWKVFTGNEIGALLANWAWLKYKQSHSNVDPSKCVVVNSTVSSKFLKALADKEGLKYDETLTGFKWIGNQAAIRMKEGYNFLFGFEEAIGFLFSDVNLDKDGVRAAAVFAEMNLQLRKQGLSIVQQLDKIYQTYGYFITRNRYFFCYDPVKMENIFNAIRNYNGSGKYPSSCGSYKIKHTRDLTTGYDDSQTDLKAILPVSKSTQMITFFFENGCVATLRGSGTEPKLKYYIELSGADPKQVEATLEDMVKSIIDTCLKPVENQLTPPSDD